jgi:hypothetical protein
MTLERRPCCPSGLPGNDASFYFEEIQMNRLSNILRALRLMASGGLVLAADAMDDSAMQPDSMMKTP